MTVSIELLDRIDDETKNRLATQARDGRRKALSAIKREYIVTVSEDGIHTSELIFPEPPDIATLARIAPHAFLAEVRVRKRQRRAAAPTPQLFAAE